MDEIAKICKRRNPRTQICYWNIKPIKLDILLYNDVIVLEKCDRMMKRTCLDGNEINLKKSNVVCTQMNKWSEYNITIKHINEEYVLFCTIICIIFTSLCKNLVKLTWVLAEAFRCHGHHFQCLTVLHKWMYVNIWESLICNGQYDKILQKKKKNKKEEKAHSIYYWFDKTMLRKKKLVWKPKFKSISEYQLQYTIIQLSTWKDSWRRVAPIIRPPTKNLKAVD